MFNTVIAIWASALTVVLATMPSAAAQQPVSDAPAMQADGQVAFPDNYREWMFLSAGLGMNYGPNAPAVGQP